MFLACDTLWKYESRSRNDDQEEKDLITANETLQHELKHLIDATLLRFRFVDGMFKGIFFGLGPMATSLLMTLFHQPGLKSAAVGFIVQCGVMGELIAHVSKNPNEHVPHERRAYRFTEKLADDPRWQNLIVMTPKQPMP